MMNAITLNSHYELKGITAFDTQHMTTTERKAPKQQTAVAEPAHEEPWCIMRTDNPEISLCGREGEGDGVPDAEVPDEETCKDCLAIWKSCQPKRQ